MYLGKGTRTRRGFQVGGVHNVGLLCTCGTNRTGNGSGDIAVLCCFHCTTPRAMDRRLCMVLHHLHHHPGSCRHLDCENPINPIPSLSCLPPHPSLQANSFKHPHIPLLFIRFLQGAILNRRRRRRRKLSEIRSRIHTYVCKKSLCNSMFFRLFAR